MWKRSDTNHCHCFGDPRTVIFTKKSLTGTGVIQQEKLNVDDLQLRRPAVSEGGGLDGDLRDEDSRWKQGLPSEHKGIYN